MKHLYILPLAISAVLLSSCVPGARISLAGKQAVRTYTVSTSYSSLEVSNAVDVVYSEQADEAVVTADSAVIQYVTVEEKGKSLKIYVSWKENGTFRYGDSGNITVTVPASVSLEQVSLRGASSFTSDIPLKADSFRVKVSGASKFKSDIEVESDLDIELGGASRIASAVSAGVLDVNAGGASDASLEGSADEYRVSVSGASSVSSSRAYVSAGTFRCDISGASDCHVKCSGRAEGEVSGASSVVVYGDGAVDISSSGASSVHRR